MNAPHLYAQKLFTLDEMLTLSQCKNADDFEKIILSNHYHKQPAQQLPQSVKMLNSYVDKIDPASGTYNSAAWLVLKGTGRDYNYVNFSFTNQNHYNQLVLLLKQRGFVYVKSNAKDFGNNGKALVNYLRNGKTGIMVTLRDGGSTKITTCEIAITATITPKWPDDEN